MLRLCRITWKELAPSRSVRGSLHESALREVRLCVSRADRRDDWSLLDITRSILGPSSSRAQGDGQPSQEEPSRDQLYSTGKQYRPGSEPSMKLRAQADGNPSQETPSRRRLHTRSSQYRLISEPLYLLTVCQL
uniref:Uncharacterized protein n=1 Tax=Trichuris muris TaxID=70415 RepID=A0A5S6Q4U9_TRIMR